MDKDFEYIDRNSILLLLLLMLVIASIMGFMFCLGGVGYLIALVFCIGFVWQINHVIAFKNYFWVLKHLVLIKKVRTEDVHELKCELTGRGSSRDITIYLYYYDKGKLKKSIFLHFRMTGYRNIISFLNAIDGDIAINEVSFGIVGIKKVNGVFVLT